ncbi:MAG: hypothetical protein ABFD92_16710 [Planctomycetaceae bacterium]|nr:hypothetical protein [Planctomycetaceae bacterium]
MNALKAMQLEIEDIDFIRRDEGVVLSIFCDNPEPGADGPGCSVEVLDEWGGRWIERRFDGDTFAQSLHRARIACQENRMDRQAKQLATETQRPQRKADDNG